MLKWKRLCVVCLLIAVCYCRLENVAFNKSAKQISTYNNNLASRAIDGIDGILPSTNGCSNTKYESSPWWEVDILQDYFINSVVITHINRDTIILAHDFSIEIYKDGAAIGDAVLCYYHVGQATPGKTVLYMCKQTIKGRYVRITINGQSGDRNSLCLCEVRVFGTQLPSVNSSYLPVEVEISSTPDMTYSVQGYGQCAMRCYVLPMCHIFSVKSMITYYQCNIFIQENIQFVGNSTGSPDTKVFLM